MSKIKQAYQRAIEPNMRIIAEASKQFKIPMFATFQVGPTEFTSFCLNEDRSNWSKIKYMAYINQTWTFDEFMEKVIEDAINHGHNSAFLKAMGIPNSPKENASNAEKLRTLMQKHDEERR